MALSLDGAVDDDRPIGDGIQGDLVDGFVDGIGNSLHEVVAGRRIEVVEAAVEGYLEIEAKPVGAMTVYQYVLTVASGAVES